MVNQKKIDHIKKGKPFSLIDIAAISLSLTLCIVLVFYSCITRKQGGSVVIQQSYQNIITEYDINIDREIEIDCQNEPNGLFVVVIKNKAVYVKQSPCIGQDCVKMPEIRYSGQKIVCAQCRICISVKGEGELVAVT